MKSMNLTRTIDTSKTATNKRTRYCQTTYEKYEKRRLNEEINRWEKVYPTPGNTNFPVYFSPNKGFRAFLL